MKTPNTFVIYFRLLFSWMFTGAEVTFLIPIEEMDFFLFFSVIILCCIIGYCVISVLKESNK